MAMSNLRTSPFMPSPSTKPQTQRIDPVSGLLFKLPRAVLELSRFACEDTSRPNLMHVCVHAEGPTIAAAVATNGHYLARMRFNAEVPAGRHLIPAHRLAEIAKRRCDVEVHVDRLVADGTSVVCGVVRSGDNNGFTFPDYEQVLPRESDYEIPPLRKSIPHIGIDFSYLHDVATCMKNLARIGKSKATLGRVRYSVRMGRLDKPEDDAVEPMAITASRDLAEYAGLISADFVVMPARV